MKKLISQITSKKAFSIVEILIVISIVAILTSMTFYFFNNIGSNQSLDTTTVSVISILDEAKSNAISSKDASNYGVRIFNDKLVSFKNNYGTDNKEFVISKLLIVSTSTGIGSDIIFTNLYGDTNASGTITISILDDLSDSDVIRVYKTGIIEKQ